MKFGKLVVKNRFLILILTALLMIPSMIGMAATRVNYDMFSYLPEEMDTVVGQNELMNEFHKGGFTFLILEDMEAKDIVKLKDEILKIDHVETALWYDSLADLSIPMEVLPDELYSAFNSGDSTLMAVFFDTSTSSDETMHAVEDIRAVAGKQCFVSGMTALVLDLKNLCADEQIMYVILAVSLVSLAMILFMDSWLIPVIFIVSIGAMILVNMGTNIIFGEISYITKALSAVLQLAVTLDYSIFLWHSYNEEREKHPKDKNGAMATAIDKTLVSVIGSSITTVAGFAALCFMSFTLGRDLGLVMAKGVVLGVLGCVTLLPSMILVFDKALQKTRHKTLIPDVKGLSTKLLKVFPLWVAIFLALIVPSYYGYHKANQEVVYSLAASLPEDMEYVIANTKLRDEFDIASTHMVLVNADTAPYKIRSMIDEMNQVDGVKYALGLEGLLGASIPEEILPESLLKIVKSDKWELLLINSRYPVASDEVNAQLTDLNKIIKKYDPKAMLIGEAPCMKDMIVTAANDFKVVNVISIIAIFVIIFFVEKSLSLPVILIALIELGIFINLGLSHYLGERMSFITPICISTIQLGATVDYAILMTTRYKLERQKSDRRTAVWTALYTSIPSILVSGTGLFAATFGVAMYSQVENISSICRLLARGSVINMLLVIFILPAMFMLFDRVICRTTKDMLNIKLGEVKGRKGNE